MQKDKFGQGGGGGGHFTKTFSIWYMLNIKNSIFNPYLLIGTCPMSSTYCLFCGKISFSLKLFSDHFYEQSFIKTVRGPLNSRLDNTGFMQSIGLKA